MIRFNRDDPSAHPDILTSAENLNFLDERQSELFISRMAMIRELAHSIYKSAGNAEELREKYMRFLPSSLSPESLGDHPEPKVMAKCFSALSVLERIYMCREIDALMGSKKRLHQVILGEAKPCSHSAKGRISYLKNNFTDEAFLVFSSSVRSARCSYFDSFDTVCESVHSGESEFCILPIESSSDGKLLSFYSIIDRYELKIVSTCIIDHTGSSKFTRFALLGRSVDIPTKSVSEHLRFELRITQSSADTSPIFEILRAADVCGMSLFRIDSLPLPYSDAMLSYYAVFSIKDADLSTFLTYLAFEFPQCYAMGIYQQENQS